MREGRIPDIPAGRFALGITAFVVVLVGFPIVLASSGAQPGPTWFAAYVILLSILPELIFYLPVRGRTGHSGETLPESR